MHALIYSDDAPATRAFFRDVVGLAFVRDGDGEPPWLIFATGPSEFGVHPTHAEQGGQVYESPRHHAVSFLCDDVEATRAELEGRGATFSSPITDRGFGLTTMMDVPGADPVMLYQPVHELAYRL
jgi:catechol 2,3-dioxygenase-like lactoylglutathione lyase family enzyme